MNKNTRERLQSEFKSSIEEILLKSMASLKFYVIRMREVDKCLVGSNAGKWTNLHGDCEGHIDNLNASYSILDA